MGDLIAIVGLDLEHGTCNTKKIRMTSDPANRLISVNDVVCAVSGVSHDHIARTLRELFAREPEVRQADPPWMTGLPRHICDDVAFPARRGGNATSSATSRDDVAVPQKREGMI